MHIGAGDVPDILVWLSLDLDCAATKPIGLLMRQSPDSPIASPEFEVTSVALVELEPCGEAWISAVSQNFIGFSGRNSGSALQRRQIFVCPFSQHGCPHVPPFRCPSAQAASQDTPGEGSR